MHVHHPRLVKRRYLLLNSAPRHFVPIFAAEPVVIRVQREIYHIFFFFIFPTGNSFRYLFGLMQAENRREDIKVKVKVDRQDYVSSPRFLAGP